MTDQIKDIVAFVDGNDETFDNVRAGVVEKAGRPSLVFRGSSPSAERPNEALETAFLLHGTVARRPPARSTTRFHSCSGPRKSW